LLVRAVRLAVILDLCCVLAFVIIGRASHARGESVAGIASTAWPFLAGLLGGWLGTRAWRRPLALVPSGLGAWLGAVGLGMVLRVVAGQGTAVAFVLVALAFLGLFLLGWRVAAAALIRRPRLRLRRRARVLSWIRDARGYDDDAGVCPGALTPASFCPKPRGEVLRGFRIPWSLPPPLSRGDDHVRPSQTRP
jgi:hypothetical protein